MPNDVVSAEEILYRSVKPDERLARRSTAAFMFLLRHSTIEKGNRRLIVRSSADRRKSQNSVRSTASWCWPPRKFVPYKFRSPMPSMIPRRYIRSTSYPDQYQ